MGTGTPLHEHMTDLLLGNAWLHSYCNLYVLFLRLIVQSPSLHEVYGHVLFQLHCFISFEFHLIFLSVLILQIYSAILFSDLMM